MEPGEDSLGAAAVLRFKRYVQCRENRMRRVIIRASPSWFTILEKSVLKIRRDVLANLTA